MEKQIKQLVELSKAYFDFGLRMKLKDGTHNVLRGNFKGYSCIDSYKFSVQANDNKEIRVYFADERSTKAINFGEVEFCEWTNKITFPVTLSAEDLQSIHDDALEFFNFHLIKYLTD